jgi:hypothetical protein
MTAVSRAPRLCALLLLFLLQSGSFAVAQISPAEITNPRLKEPEQIYFAKLLALNRAVGRISFPFPFSTRRYIGLNPKNQLGADTRGLEFVLFHNRLVLKISGDYNAAFNSALLTQNQRARRVFNGVVLPILGLLPQYFSSSAKFDGFGIEVAYHVRTQTHAYQYEGVEILTMVLSKAGALGYPRARDEARRQQILDESEIYLDNKRFGLALKGREPYPLETLDGGPHGETFPTSEDHERRPSGGAGSTPSNPEGDSVGSGAINPVASASDYSRSSRTPGQDVPMGPPSLPATVAASVRRRGIQSVPGGTGSSRADLDALQNKYHQQFAALAKQGAEQYHLVKYAPPSLVTFRHQIYLQLTLRNPTPFDRSAMSLYKRAAQDFDLFLAPLLKPILHKTPDDDRIAGLDITILNQFGAQDRQASEAIEFLCPLPLLRQFANAEVTSQDVINHTVVLVNGMRIGLDLQRVE